MKTATYVHRWETEEYSYFDTTKRSGRIMDRRMWPKDGNILTGYASGPMSESEKRHGKWSIGYKDVWYFYGEEVTEAEWHRSNK